MKTVGHFGLMLALLVSLVAPAMACALPNANLSPAERACCKQMKGQCGSMGMPASHGCCHKEIPTAAHWNVAIQVKAVNVQIALSGISEPQFAFLLPLPVFTSETAQWPGSTLPQSPPSAISVLRI